MTALRLLRSDTTGVTYADPAKPDFQIRFKTTQANKSLNGLPVANYATEIIVTDSNPVTIGSVTAKDAISVRIRVSGTVNSAARLESVISMLTSHLDAWVDEDVLAGFSPTTIPTVPT